MMMMMMIMMMMMMFEKTDMHVTFALYGLVLRYKPQNVGNSVSLM